MTTQALNINTKVSNQNYFAASLDLAGRLGLNAIFILAGLDKISHYEANAQFLASGGLPEFLLPFVIAFEVADFIETGQNKDCV